MKHPLRLRNGVNKEIKMWHFCNRELPQRNVALWHRRTKLIIGVSIFHLRDGGYSSVVPFLWQWIFIFTHDFSLYLLYVWWLFFFFLLTFLIWFLCVFNNFIVMDISFFLFKLKSRRLCCMGKWIIFGSYIAMLILILINCNGDATFSYM